MNGAKRAIRTRINVEQLVKASQNGERQAFDELVWLYQNRALRLAVRITGDAHEAAEAVQDGFVSAFVRIEKLREPGKFEGWLLRIVSNAAISRLRASSRRIDRIRLADCDIKARADDPDSKEKSAELKMAIQRAMRKLSKKEAMAISLFGLDDLSHKQTAEIMGCSEGAARWHVHKARKKLKKLLEEYM